MHKTSDDIINLILFRNAPDPISILDIDGIIQDCNFAFEKLYGYPKNEILGKQSCDFLTENSRAIFEEKLPKIKRGNPQVGVVEVFSKNREIVYIWRKGVPIVNGDNIVDGLIFFDRDITSQRVSKQKLEQKKEDLEKEFDVQTSRINKTNKELKALIVESKKTKEKSQSILNAIPDMLFILDKDGRFLDFSYENPLTLIAMPKDFMGKKLEDILPPHVTSLAKTGIQETLKTKQLQCFEYEINIEGELFCFEARMVYKNRTEVVAIIRNITKQSKALDNLNKSEKLLKTIVNSTQEAVIAINSKSEIVIFNPAAEQMFQISNREMSKSNIERILPDEYKEEHPQWVSSYFNTGNPDAAMGKTLELQAKRNSGELFDIEISISPGDMGNERIAVAVIRDITLRKKAESEMLAAKEKAIENDRLKSAFLANMSHEIRTPMNSILGFSNLLSEVETNEERDKYIEIINSNGHLLMNLINDIIDISKIEAGLTKAYMSSFMIRPEMEKIFNLFLVHDKCKSGKVKLKMKISSNIKDEIISADKTKLNQILINLVNNAIKFTDEGLIEFGYSKVLSNQKEVIQFFVKDNGIGISKEDQELIFDRFRQVDVADRNAFGGTGLGLSISKSFANLMGGDIYVESEVGKGSSFFITIPALKKKNQISRPLPKIKFLGFKNWKGKKILVVEDNDANYLIFKAYLKNTGVELFWVKTGEKAVEYFKENNSIDMILMDIKLPGMNGYEATRQIKAIRNNIPVIAQTAYAMDSDRQRSIDAGCDSFISKPILKDKLYNVLTNYFD